MPTLDEIREQIGHLYGASRFLGRKEIKELPSILWEDEKVERLVQGSYGSGMGVLVGNQQTVDLRRQGHRQAAGRGFPLRQDLVYPIQDRDDDGRDHHLHVRQQGRNQERVEGSVQELRRVSACADDRGQRTRERTCGALRAPAADTVVDQLERLAKLKEQGILTEEEFQAQKQRVLNG